MKKIAICMMFVGFLFSAACGGGGGESQAQQAADASYEAFGTIINTCIPNAQVVDSDLEAAFPGAHAIKGDLNFGTGKDIETCNCPGGGTLVLDTDTFTLTATDCKSNSGLNYNGTLSSDDGGQTIDGNMTEFGECDNVTADGVGTDACTGTVSGTCANTATTCTVVDGSGEECDVNCN